MDCVNTTRGSWLVVLWDALDSTQQLGAPQKCFTSCMHRSSLLSSVSLMTHMECTVLLAQVRVDVDAMICHIISGVVVCIESIHSPNSPQLVRCDRCSTLRDLVIEFTTRWCAVMSSPNCLKSRSDKINDNALAQLYQDHSRSTSVHRQPFSYLTDTFDC